MSFRYGALRDSIVESIRKSTEGRDIGVAFSGGLDSGLAAAVAKKYANSVKLYTCGTEGSHDVIMAKDLSERLELPWTHVRISKDNTRSLIAELIAAAGVSDPFTISYELQLFCVCRTSEEDTILTGQGADEFFMGCAKFVDQTYEEYEALRISSVDRLLNVSIPCEKAIAAHFHQELMYPYLDPAVLSEVERIDPAVLRPKDLDSRKSVLKEIAADLGYPSIAGRVKKSSQYGSRTTDVIRALAKDKGLYYNQYIESIYNEVMGLDE